MKYCDVGILKLDDGYKKRFHLYAIDTLICAHFIQCARTQKSRSSTHRVFNSNMEHEDEAN